MQGALNALNYPSGTLGASLKLDGSFGSFSRTALTKFYSLRGAEGRVVLRGMVLYQHSVRYISLTLTAP